MSFKEKLLLAGLTFARAVPSDLYWCVEQSPTNSTRKKEKIQLTFRFAICSLSRSSFSRASGVKFSPRSVKSYTGRISTSDSPGIGFGQRFNHSTASSMDRTCQIQ